MATATRRKQGTVFDVVVGGHDDVGVGERIANASDEYAALRSAAANASILDYRRLSDKQLKIPCRWKQCQRYLPF